MLLFPFIFFFIQLCLFCLFLIFFSNISFYLCFFILPSSSISIIILICFIFYILSIRYIKNPIYILLNIVFSFILLSFLLFKQHCELLTYTFIIVYLGALMLLFLFIVMLLNIQNIKKNSKSILEQSIYCLTFLSFILFLLKYIMQSILFIHKNEDIQFTALFFYNSITCNDSALIILFQKPMLFLFMLISILLLFVLVASITTISAIKIKN